MVKKKVLITGGTAGIGRAIAIELGKLGYRIFLIGRSETKLADLKKDVSKLGIENNFEYALVDLTDFEPFVKLIDDWEIEHGPFDVLINNAGIEFDSVQDKSIEELAYLLHTNLLSYMWLAGKIASSFKKNKIQGDIIQIGSMSATSKDANSSGYVATKSAIRGFNEAFRKELNPIGVRVLLIEPGLVATDMQHLSKEEEINLQKEYKMLMAEDVSQLVTFVLQADRRIDMCEIKIKPTRQEI